MEYANNYEQFNSVNENALKIIPKSFHLSLDLDDYSELSNKIVKIENEILALKDNASLYENIKFSTHLKLRKLKNKLNSLNKQINNIS